MPISKSELLKFKRSMTPKQLDALVPKGTKLVRALPAKTTLDKMGLPPATFKKLSPAAKKLTKGDLVALWADQTTARAGAVTLKDINIIKKGFGEQVGTGSPVAMDIYCCCCPCCCATAVVEPATPVA